MSETRRSVGEGLEPARRPRPIRPGERVHVVGAAGAGASAAALLAHHAGADVSGCDPGAPTPYTEALESRAIDVAPLHAAEHVSDAPSPPERLAVTKALTAVDPDHPELEAARRWAIPIEAWQQLVADAAATQGGRLVAIAGTHGKSTTAGWLVHMLVESGRDPAAFVGALLSADVTGDVPATARWGGGPVFVVEADEYAGNFDPYRPSLAAVLNVDWDHPDVFADRAAVVDAFESWLRAPGATGRRVVINVGDEGGRELAARLAGWSAGLARYAPAGDGLDHVDVSWSLDGDRLTVADTSATGGSASSDRARDLPGTISARLSLPGAHNAANAVAVAIVAASLGSSAPEIVAGLESFGGVGRRMDIKGEAAGVLVIDDYGHHPAAIEATLAAVRDRYPDRRTWIAHEPLTFHRAAAMRAGLASALAEADRIVVADIWAGRDPDTSIASAAELAEAVAELTGRDVAAPGSVETTAEYLAGEVEAGDVVLVMGGGRSYVIAERLLALLRASGAE